ncbi:MAG: 50S ribosomal protein L25/general stress protein Ctc [Bowdeniella nasicola]|nr:50S ribosomal protein L25/general stress protein Ctc [Bowdeniella nasicola]
MAEKLAAEVRTEFGKGAARRMRRDGKIPAVIYGHGEKPVHLTLPGHDTFLLVKDNINALLEVTYDDDKSLALVKDLQRNPVNREIEHIDLVIVKRDQTVEVEVPVTLVGEPEPGTIAFQELGNLTVNAPVIAIPEQIEISVEGLPDGYVLRVEDLQLDEGVTTDLDPEQPLVMVQIPRIDESDLEVPSDDDDEVADEAAAETDGEEEAGDDE